MVSDRDAAAQDALLLGRYRVDRIIGEGAFGQVVLAFDTRLKRRVAIKTLKRTGYAADPDRFHSLDDRFVREAEAGSRVGDNPNIVNVYDLGTDTDGTRYLILQYVPGGTLADRLKRGPIPLADSLRLTIEIARGLEAAHEAGIVHRDIKPANIFIAADGRAQVGDFGIAQLDHLSGRTEIGGRHPGTPLYMSPEQEQTTGYVHPVADEYSLGLTLFEMVTGLAYRRLLPPDVTARLATLPPSVAALIRRMTAVTPSDRYPSLVDVVRETESVARLLSVDVPAAAPAPPGTSPSTDRLRSAPTPTPTGEQPTEVTPLGTERAVRRADVTARRPPAVDSQAGRATRRVAPPPSANPPPVSDPPRPPPGSSVAERTDAPATTASPPQPVSRRAVVRGIGGLVLAGGAVGGGILFVRQNGKGSPATVTPPAVPILHPPTTTNGAFANANEAYSVAFSPDGQFIVAGWFDRTARVWSVSDRVLIQTLTGHTNTVFSVAYSADGQTLATGSQDMTARLWRVSDGAPLRTLTGHTGPVMSVAFSGQALATGSNDKTARVWRVSDGALVRALTGHTDTVRAVAFAAGGQALVTGSVDQTIHIWRTSDWASVGILRGHTDIVNSIAITPDGQTIVSGSYDRTARLWRISDGALLRTLTGHTDEVHSVACSTDGQLVATGSRDTTVRLWRASDGAPLRTLTGHTQAVESVTFSADGTTLATASSDSTVRLWRVV